MIVNLTNKKDGEKYKYKSHKKISWTCQYCDFVFEQMISDVTRRGFKCPICHNGMSYPNRFMMEVLRCLNINFEREASFNWSNNKRYDFYIKPNIIIEVNGEQHYKHKAATKFKQTLHEIQENDAYKKELALKNGIEKYIEINASSSMDSFLKNSIITELSDIFDFSNFDWQVVSDNLNKNLAKQCVDLWNINKNVGEIAKILSVSIDCVRDKLKLLSSVGKCDYTPLKSWQRDQKRLSESNKKPVVCITTNKEFDSINEAANYYNILPTALSNCLVGRTKSSGKLNNEKLYWKFKEEN